MSNIIKKENYPYVFNQNACSTCEGRCCTGETGYIYISKTEINSIAELLNLSVNDFSVEYLFKKDYKYSIKEQKFNDSYECVFYDRSTNGCKIYKARPSQCTTFPFWDYYKTRVDELKDECPGIIDV